MFFKSTGYYTVTWTEKYTQTDFLWKMMLEYNKSRYITNKYILYFG